MCVWLLCEYNGVCVLFVFFFKQKTAYEMRISDWSSDVCSSDLVAGRYTVDALRADGHEPVVLSRATGVDLRTGEGLVPALAGAEAVVDATNVRSEERRVGKECVSTCRSRWSPSQ